MCLSVAYKSTKVISSVACARLHHLREGPKGGEAGYEEQVTRGGAGDRLQRRPGQVKAVSLAQGEDKVEGTWDRTVYLGRVLTNSENIKEALGVQLPLRAGAAAVPRSTPALTLGLLGQELPPALLSPALPLPAAGHRLDDKKI
jgi:hypothetical protein